MNPLKTKYLHCIAAILAAPATLNALSDYYFSISQWGCIGSGSYNYGVGTLAVGWNNYIHYDVYNSAAVGSVLQVYNSNSMVVGKYNQATIPPASFVVGNGTHNYSRSNALEVFVDGKVNMPGTVYIGKVPERGGISMGNFTATGP